MAAGNHGLRQLIRYPALSPLAITSSVRPGIWPTPLDYGAKGDGSSNDTEGFQRFLTALGDGGLGNWTGDWLVDRGTLVLKPSATAQIISTPSTLKMYRAPQISGDATFTYSGSGSGPLLEAKNPDQTSTSGAYYAGGELGNMFFIDNSGSKAIDQHGFVPRGLFYWKFGLINGYYLPGSSVYFSSDLAAGNPDPYSTASSVFLGVRSEFCNAWAYDADRLQDGGNVVLSVGAGGAPRYEITSGLSTIVSPGVTIALNATALTVLGAAFTSAWEGYSLLVPGAGVGGRPLVTMIDAVVGPTQVTVHNKALTALSSVAATLSYSTPNGAMTNAGQGTSIETLSVGATFGWGIIVGKTKHGGQQNYRGLEVAASQNGIWIPTCQNFTLRGRVEFVDASEQNANIVAGACVWPQTALKIGGSTNGGSVTQGEITLIFRVDPSTTLAALNEKPFIDLSNDPNINNLEIDILLIDNTSPTIPLLLNSLLNIAVMPVSRFVANVASAAGVTVKVNGATIFSQNSQTAISIRLQTNALTQMTIATTGFRTAGTRLGSVAGDVDWTPNGLPDAYNLLSLAGAPGGHFVTLQATTRYNFGLRLCLPIGAAGATCKVGVQVSYAIMYDDGVGALGANSGVIVEGSDTTVDNGGTFEVRLSEEGRFLLAGYRIWVSVVVAAADQNAACSLSVMAGGDPTADNCLTITICAPD